MIFDFDSTPPPIEWHIFDPEKDPETWKEWNCSSDINDPLSVGWKFLVVSERFNY